MKYVLRMLLLAAVLAYNSARPAAAQQPAVYTSAEQMPALPGRPGQQDIWAAVVRGFRLPAADQRAHTTGSILVSFVVTETGAVSKVHVDKHLTASAYAAVVRAVQQLPRLVPGRQGGRPVSVLLRLVVPVGGRIPIAALTAPSPYPPVTVVAKGNSSAPDLSDLYDQGKQQPTAVGDNPVFTYVEQMPALPGGGGQAAIVAAIQQRLALPADVAEGRVFVKFIVNKAGGVQNAEIIKGLSRTEDEAVLAAVRELPTFVPGKQNGHTVLVSLLLPITIRRD